MNSGIYTITSPSGRMYVGSAKNFKLRRTRHFYELRSGRHDNDILQKAFNKYGEENLIFSKLLCCEPKDLLMYEQRAIDILKPAYNICLIAGNCLGKKHSIESRAKMSRVQKGKVVSEESKTRMSIAQKGRTVSSEHKAKIGAANKGRIQSQEEKDKRALKNTGKKRTEEFKKRMSDMNKGRKLTSEQEIKRSLACKGKPWTENQHNARRLYLLKKSHKDVL